MLRRMMIVLVLGCLCFGSVIVSAEDNPKIAVLEWTTQKKTGYKYNYHVVHVMSFINRLKGLGITTDCLSPTELFTEKKVYEYDAVVVIPSYLTMDEYDELEKYVKGGGIFISIYSGAHWIDIDEDGHLKWPPDIYVASKAGIFHELTGGIRKGWCPDPITFEVLKSCPITEGLKVGEKIEVDLDGMMISLADEDVEVCCGNGNAVLGRKTYNNSSLIQVKRVGKGASIWITARIHNIKEPWADTLLKNIFSKKTFSWALGQDVI